MQGVRGFCELVHGLHAGLLVAEKLARRGVGTTAVSHTYTSLRETDFCNATHCAMYAVSHISLGFCNNSYPIANLCYWLL